MLDLAFVRNNLPLVEEKLRQRGLDPKRAVGDFVSVDEQRRKLITQMEQLKAQRNRASEEVAKAKKAGGDPPSLIGGLIEQTRQLREKIEQGEGGIAKIEEQLQS
jgi:seryl-tRNA synthetase